MWFGVIYFFPASSPKLLALTLSLSRLLSSKLRGKVWNFILQNCQKQTVPHESTAQKFNPQTQKAQPHLLAQGLTLGVKGLKRAQMT